MIKTFTCMGSQTFEKDGKTGKNIYYTEPFESFEKGWQGAKCGHLFTYKDVIVPKVGDNFKCLYSVAKDYQTGKDYPVLEEILLIK